MSDPRLPGLHFFLGGGEMGTWGMEDAEIKVPSAEIKGSRLS